MPRIDPNQLLKCLSVLLSPGGGIKSREEVNRLASLMTKFSKKLVSKCIYVLILKSTEADLLDMFMSAGGWDLTFNWLSDGIEMKNWPLVAELVELLLLCPVDIERLKGNNCPKLIKVLSKDPTANNRVRQLACSVVDQWLAVVKGACEASTPTSTPLDPSETKEESIIVNDSGDDKSNDATSPKGVCKITIRNGKNGLAEVISSDRNVPKLEDKVNNDVLEKLVEKDEKSVESRPILKVVNEDPVAQESLPPKKLAEGRKQSLKRKSEKRSSPEPEKKSKDKKKISPDKKPKLDLKLKSRDRKVPEKSEKHLKEKTPEEKAREEKDKQNIMKLITPSIGNLGKIPKKSKDDSKKDDKKSPLTKTSSEPKKLPPIQKDPKKYNISIETRKGGEDRPKTVKVFNSKLRSTGLEELPPPPKSTKKKEDEKKPIKRSSPVKEFYLPEKRAREEEKPLEKQPPTKPKITGLQESDVFADALTAANPVKDVKKRKRRTSISNSPSEAKKSTSENEKTVVKIEEDSKESMKPVLKFYQDTLITSEEKCDIKEEIKSEEIKAEDDSSDKPSDETVLDENVTDTLSKEEIEDEVAKAEKAIDQVLKMEEKKNVERERNRLPKGVLVYVRKNKTAKKSVTWKSDKELESIQYFELDETERVNVTKPFMDMKQMERISERILLSRKLASDDNMEEKTPWRPLIPIDIPGEQIIPGCKSAEKEIQRARERTTLQAIYFNRSLIPPTPGEPDLEIHALTEPAVIPLKDQTGNVDSIISYKDHPWPDPKGYPPGTACSPPLSCSPPREPSGPQMLHGIPPAGMFPQQYPVQPPMQPYMPGLLPSPEWMGNNEGKNMMMGGPQGNDQMMMGGMAPGMHPGLLPPPDMYHPMGGPPPHPDFMPPPYPMGGHHGMYQPGGPGSGGFPHHQDPGPRPQRPWYRGQDNVGRGNMNSGSGGGTWRHPSKGGGWNPSNKLCKFYAKKGICRQNNCAFRHGSGKGGIR